MSRLIIWRHGRTEWNQSGRFQGHHDVDLDETGVAQAADAAREIATLKPDLIVASDLRRAARTAAALAEVTGLPVQPDPRLRERCFGSWQGMTGPEISAAHPEAYARFRRGEVITDFGIEDPDEMAKRAVAGVRDAAAAAGDGTVVVVTHGGAGKAAIGEMLGWTREITWQLGPLDNCHWADLRYDLNRGWHLRAFNVGRVVGG